MSGLYFQTSSLRICQGVYMLGESEARDYISGAASAQTWLVVGPKWANHGSGAWGMLTEATQIENKKEIPGQLWPRAVLLFFWCILELFVWPKLRGPSPWGLTTVVYKEPSWTSDTRAGRTSSSVEVRGPVIYRNPPLPSTGSRQNRGILTLLGLFICQAVKRMLSFSVSVRRFISLICNNYKLRLQGWSLKGIRCWEFIPVKGRERRTVQWTAWLWTPVDRRTIQRLPLNADLIYHWDQEWCPWTAQMPPTKMLRCPQLKASQLGPLKQLLVTYPMLSQSPLCSVCPKLSLIYPTDLAPSPGGRTLVSTHHLGCFLPSLPTITNSHQVLATPNPCHCGNIAASSPRPPSS